MLVPPRPAVIAAMQQRLIAHFPALADHDRDLLSITGIWLAHLTSSYVHAGRPLPPSDVAALAYYYIVRGDVGGANVSMLMNRDTDVDGQPVGLPLIERMSTVVYAELMTDLSFVKALAASPRAMSLHSLSCWGDDAMSMVWKKGRSVADMAVEAKQRLTRNVDVLVASVENTAQRMVRAINDGIEVVQQGVVRTWDRIRGGLMTRVGRLEQAFLAKKEGVLDLIASSLDVMQAQVTGRRDAVRGRMEDLNRRMEPYFAMAAGAPGSRPGISRPDHPAMERREPTFGTGAHTLAAAVSDLTDPEISVDALSLDGVEMTNDDEEPLAASGAAPVSRRSGFARLGVAC